MCQEGAQFPSCRKEYHIQSEESTPCHVLTEKERNWWKYLLSFGMPKVQGKALDAKNTYSD